MYFVICIFYFIMNYLLKNLNNCCYYYPYSILILFSYIIHLFGNFLYSHLSFLYTFYILQFFHHSFLYCFYLLIIVYYNSTSTYHNFTYSLFYLLSLSIFLQNFLLYISVYLLFLTNLYYILLFFLYDFISSHFSIT